MPDLVAAQNSNQRLIASLMAVLFCSFIRNSQFKAKTNPQPLKSLKHFSGHRPIFHSSLLNHCTGPDNFSWCTVTFSVFSRYFISEFLYDEKCRSSKHGSNILAGHQDSARTSWPVITARKRQGRSSVLGRTNLERGDHTLDISPSPGARDLLSNVREWPSSSGPGGSTGSSRVTERSRDGHLLSSSRLRNRRSSGLSGGQWPRQRFHEKESGNELEDVLGGWPRLSLAC